MLFHSSDKRLFNLALKYDFQDFSSPSAVIAVKNYSLARVRVYVYARYLNIFLLLTLNR